MQALWAVCPSVEGMASQVADIVSQTDCSAPTPAGTQPAQVEDAPSPDS